MIYSDYCKYAPQVRYPDVNHVKKQMFKIHVPHRESGHIVKVDYQEAKDTEGNPDWEMLYTPKREGRVQAFSNRQVKHNLTHTLPILPQTVVIDRPSGVHVMLTLRRCDPRLPAALEVSNLTLVLNRI